MVSHILQAGESCMSLVRTTYSPFTF